MQQILKGMRASNIQEFVVEKVIGYVEASDEEKNRLKRRIEALYAEMSCVFCGFSSSFNPLEVQGECKICSIYLNCQNCKSHAVKCQSCEEEICIPCAMKCSCCNVKVCLKCNRGLFCFGCYKGSVQRKVGCNLHPLKEVTLSNGYRVPSCEECIRWLPGSNFSNDQVLKFYGLIHRLEKKAKIQ